MTPWVKRGKVYLSTGQNRVWRVMHTRDWPFFRVDWRPDEPDGIWTQAGPKHVTLREAKAYAAWVDNHNSRSCSSSE